MKKEKENKQLDNQEEDDSKFSFPVGALIAIGVIALLMVACIIVIVNL